MARRLPRKALPLALSTARRKGYTIPAGATVLLTPKLSRETVIMSHRYNLGLPFKDTGRTPKR